jgi:hypothetical protein
LLKFIIVVLGVGWLLGQLIRYFLRSKLAKFAKQVNAAAKEQEMEQRRSANTTKDGVHVDFVPQQPTERKPHDIKGGEYVDYEDVKE